MSDEIFQSLLPDEVTCNGSRSIIEPVPNKAVNRVEVLDWHSDDEDEFR